MPTPFSSEGSVRVRRYAAKGIRTTESPVRKAAFDALVSVWPRTWRAMPAARRSPTTNPSRHKPALPGVRRPAARSIISAVARRNRQNRNPKGGDTSSTFFTTTKEEPQTAVTATSTASARSLLDRGLGASDMGSHTIGALSNESPIRVRFAPSPTGSLHVGGARTALYNLLFARREKGTFILRIEDTDVERSREELTAQILSAMEWLGLDYDEGPHLQSQRYHLYRAAADRLIAEGKAYRAFETPEELDAERKKAEASGRSYRYSGAGREITPEESERRARAGERFVVRLAMPDETIVVDDLIRGRVEFPAEALDDFVLVRSDGHPLYHFSVCVDDADMRITHVLRGDDHLANTPKHVALFRALGAPVPAFAHLGMILGTDRKKLSKRYGAAAVEEWRDQGIFPEALVNFLALLGWSPGEDRELLSREEMEREFSLERIGASPSVFDPEKLLWMNAQYMARMPAEELLARSVAITGMSATASAGTVVPECESALKAIELHRT